MRVSRNFEVEDWKALKFKAEAEWQKAVDIFDDRMNTRYLEHIEALLHRQTSGFAVLTLDCALIETLEQFRRGTNKTPARRTGEYFVSFLTTTSFGSFFDAKMSHLFYESIRCGLHHRAEAGGSSRIKRGNGRPLVAYTEDQKGIVVNVERFHATLKEVLCSYIADLKNPGNIALRNAFRTKVNYICRIESQDTEKAPSAEGT